MGGIAAGVCGQGWIPGALQPSWYRDEDDGPCVCEPTGPGRSEDLDLAIFLLETVTADAEV